MRITRRNNNTNKDYWNDRWVRIFRHQDHKDFNENPSRKEGYKLSISGNLLYKILIKVMPAQFCNLCVIIAEK